jgi:hypothetical protein
MFCIYIKRFETSETECLSLEAEGIMLNLLYLVIVSE